MYMAKNTAKTDKSASKVIEITLAGRTKINKRAGEIAKMASEHMQAQQWPVAISMLAQVVEKVPAYELAWNQLFEACLRVGDFESQFKFAEKCLAKRPRSISALIARGSAARMLLNYDQAFDDLNKAVKLNPTNVNALNQLGVIHKELGENDVAIACFNRCIAIKPSYSQAYWNRSDILDRPTREDIAAMQHQLNKSQLSHAQSARLHYSIARAYEFLGDYENQFKHVEAGAAAKRAQHNYKIEPELDEIKRIPNHFTREVLRAESPNSNSSVTPIFICGLPRSGTTLVEQILSSHPEVTAGDEINALPYATSLTLRKLGIDNPFPLWASELSDKDWRNLGEDYLQNTRHLQETPYFTDKNLQNYKAIGVIHNAMPEAKIIYCRRDPMDNLWGCYRQLFGDGQLFTYDQHDLANMWRVADDLMQYWKDMLADRVYIFDYEDLIANQEATTRQLLTYIGLPWNDTCLKFYENKRAVKTISSVQVRSPITDARIGLWKRYEPWLQELIRIIRTKAP